jgi:hypothetical protein
MSFLAEKRCTILNKQMFAESKKHLQEPDADLRQHDVGG